MTLKKLIIMVSSTVYGNEELLDRVYAILTSTQHYEVWLSHKGTMPVFSSRSAFENCLIATEKCDLFLGLITPNYGTGEDDTGLSITHQEILKAIELNKPRWFLVHDHVVFARYLLTNLGYEGTNGRKKLHLSKNKVFSDLRVIDMYEAAIRDQIPFEERQGNWVQKFKSDDDALLFAVSQFSRFQDVEEFVWSNLTDLTAVTQKVQRKGGHQ